MPPRLLTIFRMKRYWIHFFLRTTRDHKPTSQDHWLFTANWTCATSTRWARRSSSSSTTSRLPSTSTSESNQPTWIATSFRWTTPGWWSPSRSASGNQHRSCVSSFSTGGTFNHQLAGLSGTTAAWGWRRRDPLSPPIHLLFLASLAPRAPRPQQQ